MTPMTEELEPIWTRQTALFHLRPKISKLSKKAEKLGSGPITMEVVEEKEVERKNESGRSYEPKRFDTWVRLEISGEEPKLNGWRFVATISHDFVEGDEKTSGYVVAMIRKSPFFEGDISEDAFSNEPRCDHCNTIRRRNDTYVVEHEDGRQAQVGSNCLSDFTGHGSPEAVIRFLALLWAARELAEAGDVDPDEPGYWDGGTSDPAFELDEFLAATNAAIRDDGWMSRTRANGLGMGATADQAISFLFEPHWKSGKNKGELKLNVTDEDHRVAQLVINGFLETLDPTIEEDYLWNLAVIRDVGLVRWKTAGYAASMINAAEKQKAREIEFEDLQGSEWIGDVKDRLDFEAKLLFTTSWEGRYGPTFLYKFLTVEGNVLVWFASRYQNVDVGESYSFKATVKNHDERDGIKQTIVNRATFTPQAALELEDAK